MPVSPERQAALDASRTEWRRRSKRAERIALSFLASMIVLLLLVLGLGFAWLARDKRAAEHRAYEYWIEETGNPRQLTFEQWKSVTIRAYRPER